MMAQLSLIRLSEYYNDNPLVINTIKSAYSGQPKRNTPNS